MIAPPEEGGASQRMFVPDPDDEPDTWGSDFQ